ELNSGCETWRMIDVDEEVGTIVGNVPRLFVHNKHSSLVTPNSATHPLNRSFISLDSRVSSLDFGPLTSLLALHTSLDNQTTACRSISTPIQLRVSSVTLHPHLCGDSVVDVLESFYRFVLASSLWFCSNLPSTLVLPSTVSFSLQVPGISSLIFPQRSSYHHLSLTIISFLLSVVCSFILYPATLVFLITTPSSHLPQHS
ncbi:hypothetical protein BJ138DRAFT_1106207, partial [Hygrophoropsis aurantiaca]